MRTIICVALLLAAPAAAQPVASSSRPCQVTIARAPDEVRTVVEAWVRTEPVCSVALEIRIVPTEGGLYLLAQDEHNRMRERIVPDAQTAGVLVASWIADDNAPPAPPIVVPPPIAPPPMRAPVAVPPPTASMPVNEMIAPPGLAPIGVADRAPAAPPAQAHHSKWITAAALFPMSDSSGGGVRLDLDVWRRKGFVIGVAGSYVQANGYLSTASGWGEIQTWDTKVAGTAAYSWLRGRWLFRPSIGFGFLHTEGTAFDYNVSYDLVGTFPTMEVSFAASRELGANWAVYAGPLATLIAQSFYTYSSNQPYEMTVTRGTIDLALLAGVRHRL